MVRIAVVFHDAIYNSGATRSMIELVEYWHKNKVFNIIAIFPVKGSAYEYLCNFGIQCMVLPYYNLNFISTDKRLINAYYIFKTFVKSCFNQIFTLFYLSKKLKRLKLDLIYINSSVNTIGINLKKALKIPIIWHIRENGMLQKSFNILGGYKRFGTNVSKYADKIVMISKATLEGYNQYIKADKTVVCYDDVSSQYIQNIKNNYYEDELNLIISGVICESKGQFQVVHALKVMKTEKQLKIKLYICGEGEETYIDIIKQYIKKNNLENDIFLMGIQNNMNLIRKKMHIEVIASRYEAFGRVTIEAMLSKLAVVASDTGANQELIKNLETGMLYEYKNISNLIQQIEYLYWNRNEIKKYANNSFNFAIQFTENRCAKKIEKVIIQTLGKKYEI